MFGRMDKNIYLWVASKVIHLCISSPWVVTVNLQIGGWNGQVFLQAIRHLLRVVGFIKDSHTQTSILKSSKGKDYCQALIVGSQMMPGIIRGIVCAGQIRQNWTKLYPPLRDDTCHHVIGWNLFLRWHGQQTNLVKDTSPNTWFSIPTW